MNAQEWKQLSKRKRLEAFLHYISSIIGVASIYGSIVYVGGTVIAFWLLLAAGPEGFTAFKSPVLSMGAFHIARTFLYFLMANLLWLSYEMFLNALRKSPKYGERVKHLR